MMPVSISHEGYSAKPMHSYWDNFWALRGYKDAVEVADGWSRPRMPARFAASRDQFRDDLYALARRRRRSSTASTSCRARRSSAISIPPRPPSRWRRAASRAGCRSELLRNTFERYWHEFEQRRDGKREWKDYTPYEWRNVAAFVRLGWRERAWEAVRVLLRRSRAAGLEPVGRSRVAHAAQAVLRRRPAACVGRRRTSCARRWTCSPTRARSDDSLVLAAGIPIGLAGRRGHRDPCAAHAAGHARLFAVASRRCGDAGHRRRPAVCRRAGGAAMAVQATRPARRRSMASRRSGRTASCGSVRCRRRWKSKCADV